MSATSGGLGAATIIAQQELSEKFGIPTFTVGGDVSTVPTSGRLTRINVGTGAFAETSRSFTTKLQNFITQAKDIGGQIGHTVFVGGGQTFPLVRIPTPGGGSKIIGIASSPEQFASATTTDKFLESLDQFKSSIGSTGLILGAVLLAVLVLKK